MRRLRFGALIVGITLVAEMAFGPPAQAGPPAPVTFTFTHITGDLCQGIESSGSWAASGAFSDAGTLTGFDFGNRTVTRTLVSIEGTITFQITFLTLVFGDTGFTETDRWVIFSGTGAYAGLRAQGTGQGAATFSGDPTCPTVSGGGISTGRVTTI